MIGLRIHNANKKTPAPYTCNVTNNKLKRKWHCATSPTKALCEAGCTANDDCDAGLICKVHRFNQKVSGCAFRAGRKQGITRAKRNGICIKKPTKAPTDSPSESPTVNPTDSPSESPSFNPTDSPSESPSFNPTDSPSDSPTDFPTINLGVGSQTYNDKNDFTTADGESCSLHHNCHVRILLLRFFFLGTY